MANRGPLVGVAALLAVLGVGSLVGGVVGVGPLAATTPPDQVTDPGKMVARSLQATLDASSVHLDATLAGSVPGTVLGRDEPLASLDGITASADLRPRDARTQVSVDGPDPTTALEVITVWGDAWVRHGHADPWTKVSLGDVGADTGLDINPLAFVDRVRAYLAEPGHEPTVRDVACAAASGTCRHIVIDAGQDAAPLLRSLLPEVPGSTLEGVQTTLTLDAEASTLRPVRLVVEMTSVDGAVDLQLAIDATSWDAPVRIEEPPSGS